MTWKRFYFSNPPFSHFLTNATKSQRLPQPLETQNKSSNLLFFAFLVILFPKNTTQRCGDFFENRRLDLLFPKPAAIPLHLHDNGWCQKERPCGGKKIRAANENRNFTEVLDCTIIAYSFLRNGYNYCLASVFRKMEIAYKNGTAFREIPMKEEYGLSMLLASGFLQGCATKHESGRWGLHQWLLSCGGVCKQNGTANQGMVFVLIG